MPALNFNDSAANSRTKAILEERARRLGIDIPGLLDLDRKLLKSSDYPTSDCFHPHEIEQFFAIDEDGVTLSDPRLEHAETCPMCAALLDIAAPSEHAVERFLADARNELALAPLKIAAAPVRSRNWDPIVNAAVFHGIAIAAAGGVVIWLVHDIAISIALSPILMRAILLIVTSSIIICAGVFVAVNFLPKQQSRIQRFGGVVAGGAFAALLVFYCVVLAQRVNTNLSELVAAQRSLVERIGDYAPGSLPEGAFFTTVADVGGNVVASSMSHGAVSVYFNSASGSERKILGTIYSGVVERASNGDLEFVVQEPKRQTYHLSPSEPARVGDHLTALVSEASGTVAMSIKTAVYAANAQHWPD